MDRIAQLEERLGEVLERVAAMERSPADLAADRRLSRHDLAERYHCSERNIDRKWRAGGLPPPHTDGGRIWWWLSQLVEHDRTLARAAMAPRTPKHRLDDSHRALGRAAAVKKAIQRKAKRAA